MAVARRAALSKPVHMRRSTRRASARPTVCMAETTDQATARRNKEQQRLDERTMTVASKEEFDAALALAGDNLVMIDIYSDEVCEMGDEAFSAPPTWNTEAEAKDAMMEPCRRLASSFSRIARECDDATFIMIDADESDETEALAKELGVSVFPTFQAWKHGDMLFQHAGAGGNVVRDLGEAALYLGNQGAGGEHVTDFIKEVGSKSDLEDFHEECAVPMDENPNGVKLETPCDKQLGVLMVSKEKDSPACMHSFPAVVAMAKNTRGSVRWARLMGDVSADATALYEEVAPRALPTFVFYVNGVEQMRHQGQDRVALMQAVMKFQKDNGVRLPEPPPRKRMSIAEARKIQEAKRAAARAAGVRPQGW
mmetsp:Transcript_23277/g.79209  ORF Transcript_23277/g.79209 Transcript_23277/m.79209 type:complete len:367 (+) Transcript_23277:39-1139(+)